MRARRAVDYSKQSKALRAEALLAEINEAETKYAGALRKDPNYDVPGELAGINYVIQEELKTLGYVAVWRDGKYVLEKIQSAGGKGGNFHQ